MVEPHRVTYELMPSLTPLIMYLVLSGFAIVFFYGLYRRVGIYFEGGSRPEFHQLWPRIGTAAINAFAQRKVVKKSYPGLMHLLIYSGIIVLFIGTTLVFFDFDIWQTLLRRQFLTGNFYFFFKVFLDAFGLLAIAGCLLAISRRAFTKPINLPTIRDDIYILSVLIVILVTGYVTEGIRLAVDKVPWAYWSFVGYRIALVLEEQHIPSGELTAIYGGLWWFHALLSFTAVASIPYTKLFHIFTSPLNALATHRLAKGKLSTPFDLRALMASQNFDAKVGAETLTDFSWHQRLSFDSCTSCGRCSDSCPATAAGTPLSPMRLILKLRDAMRMKANAGKRKTLIADIVDDEELWACTTCRACVEECPVLIDHVDAIVDMRRHLVAQGRLDRPKRDLLTSLTNLKNPYGLPHGERGKWARDLDVKTVKDRKDFEVLYWVGCAGSYDPRNQQISRAIVKILNAANVPFAILGDEEQCNCEVARRLGEEGRFQQAALELVEVFKKHNVKLLLTQCPHCYNTFRNEYPEFGANFKVVHHSQFIQYLISEGRLRLKQTPESTVTYHDPCYLGRYNGIFDTPREVIRSLGRITLREMQRCRDRSFCCGAGGANLWYKVKGKEKINSIRYDEAQRLKADVLVTACPFCTSMFEDAAASKEMDKSIAVSDLAELVAELVA